MTGLRRRDLVPLLAAFAATRPFWARAQQPRIPVVGFLGASNPGRAAAWLAAWRKGLAEAGFVEGRTLAIEYRWADSELNRVPALMADLVARRVDVIMTPIESAATAAKGTTATIPTVFAHIADPVGVGLVESFTRPGGNATGIAGHFETLAEKRLQLLHELVPGANRIGYLIDHEHSNPQSLAVDVERITLAGKTLGVEVILLRAGKPEEIESALAAGSRNGIGAIVLQFPSTLVFAQQQRLADLLSRHRLPAAGWGDFATHGGLLSYANDLEDIPYQAGLYVGRILRGAKPADLPVMQSTKYKLVINMKTANALGLTVPPTLLARADELIE